MSIYTVDRIRQDFPALQQTVHDNQDLVYLDNAATTLKPQSVIDIIAHHYSTESANIHRGVHTLSERATAKYEAARESVRSFINAADTQSIVFTSGTTGAPKGAVGSQGGLYQAACQLYTWFKVVLEDYQDVYVATFPMFHVAGNVAVFGTAIRGRNPVVLVPNPRDIDDLVKVIKTLFKT